MDENSALTPEQIYEAYSPRIYNLCRRLLNNDADAQDVTQDIFLQVMRKLPEYRGESALPTWLYRVAVNAALAFRRKRGIQDEHYLHDPHEDFLEDGGHAAKIHHWVREPEERALDHEKQQIIEAAIAKLPDVYRDVYVLADVEDLHSQEIADMLGLGLPAVKSRLHRARSILRRTLAPYFEEGMRDEG